MQRTADWKLQDHTTLIDWKSVIGGVLVGAILGISATIFYFNGRLSAVEQGVSDSRQHGQTDVQSSTSADVSRPSAADHADPNQLIQIIEQQQRLHVKASVNEWASGSFTEADLKHFLQEKVANQVAEQLKHDNQFISVVAAIQALPPTQRQKLLRTARKPLHPTWAQLGRISPEGQTQAGQTAEMTLATAIVDLAEQLLALSPAQLRKYYV